MSNYTTAAVGQMKARSFMFWFPRQCYSQFVPSKYPNLKEGSVDFGHDFASDIDYKLAHMLVDKNERKKRFDKVRGKIFHYFHTRSAIANEIMALIELKQKIRDYIRVSIESFRATK